MHVRVIAVRVVLPCTCAWIWHAQSRAMIRIWKILPRRDEWSLLFRIESQLPINNVNTSNYAWVSFRVTKDLKFNRHCAFNQLELLTIECDDSLYYTQKNVEYTVDMELRICSCLKRPCKHRKIVATSQNTASFDIAEVEFVNAVTAGGSVKFFPAV